MPEVLQAVPPTAVEPNAMALDGHTPTIRLAGKAWPIPPLAPRQNRIVTPNLLRVLPLFGGLNAEALRDPAKAGVVLSRLGVEEYDALLDAAYAALTRAHPTLTRPAFDNMPIETIELLNSIEVLAAQTGLFTAEAKAKVVEAHLMGEKNGDDPQTGTR